MTTARLNFAVLGSLADVHRLPARVRLPRTSRQTDPTLADSPGLVLGLIATSSPAVTDPVSDSAALQRRRTAATAQAMARLDSAPGPDRQTVEHALGRAQQVDPLREDNQFYADPGPPPPFHRVPAGGAAGHGGNALGHRPGSSPPTTTHTARPQGRTLLPTREHSP